MASSGRMEGQRVLITGGTRGIGFATAERFLTERAQVFTCGRREPEALPEGGGRKAGFRATDLRDPEDAKALVDEAAAAMGGLDLVLNNAGGSPAAEAATVSPRFVEKIVALNLLAPFHVAQPANLVMREQEHGGQIINIGSVSGRTPAPGTSAYSAAKAGLTQLTRALAMEWAPKVRVNQITVGLVRTPDAETHYGSQAAMDEVAGSIPLQRMAVPEDIAGTCLLLASPDAGYVNGADLLVDGGGELPPRAANLDSGA